ncbi:MAG TPA: phosphatidylglycerol lysyltransferase domain-containing protein [Calditrichia bacterium]|nr:DUF2156 domain-containing protein [Calditrichota bacterium]HQV31089.1 phosphatidylglycerol lysyltransferase domain-containing protein [Calditrichia bacterium]
MREQHPEPAPNPFPDCDLPLSWYRTRRDSAQWETVPLPLSGQTWLTLASLPPGGCLQEVLPGARPPRGGWVLRGCRHNTAVALEQQGWSKALIGMEAVLPLQASSPLRRSLKELIRRGLRHGAVAELSRSAENLEHFAAFRDRSRHGREPQLRHLFQNSWMPEFRIFGFESHAGGWLGLLMLSPHGERDWHVELMLRHPGAPVGIMEALADHVHRSLAGEGFERWSLGEIPFHYPLAPDNRFSRTARQVGKLGNFIYNARGLRRFKGKFDPHWEPLYVCASQGLSWRLFADLMVQSGYLTLLRHRLLHFGLTRPQRRVATAK